MYWQTSRRKIPLDKPLVMGILNVTPDSFSDGGEFVSVDAALRQAEVMAAEGAHIIDIGGESTRPGSRSVEPDEEIGRIAPIVKAVAANCDIPVSVDTSKSLVAMAAIDAGAEIINDISGLRFDEAIADVASDSGAGLVLMYSRGDFASMHTLPPVDDILAEVITDLRRAESAAIAHGVGEHQIVIDPGFGFGKTFEQNVELLTELDRIVAEFRQYPLLAGVSRKSFIGKMLGDVPTGERLNGSLAAAVMAVSRGAAIVRVHDVGSTVEALKVTAAIK
jgi:dihydropteroate synthase